MSKTGIRKTKADQELGKENRRLPKAPTGIQGLDEITQGGFPRGRPTLICGSAGAGKTLLAMEFLIRGATEYNEPGVFMAFEETAPELTQNVRSLGFDLDELAKEKKLVIDFVRIERSEIDERPREHCSRGQPFEPPRGESGKDHLCAGRQRDDT